MGFLHEIMKVVSRLLDPTVTVNDAASFQRAMYNLKHDLRKISDRFSQRSPLIKQKEKLPELLRQETPGLIQQSESQLHELEEIKKGSRNTAVFFENFSKRFFVYDEERKVQLQNAKQEEIRKNLFQLEFSKIRQAHYEDDLRAIKAIRDMISAESDIPEPDSTYNICRWKSALNTVQKQKCEYDERNGQLAVLKNKLVKTQKEYRRFLEQIDSYNSMLQTLENEFGKVSAIKTTPRNQYDKVKQASNVWQSQSQLLSEWQSYENTLQETESKIHASLDILTDNKNYIQQRKSELTELLAKQNTAIQECHSPALPPLEQKIRILQELIQEEQRSIKARQTWDGELLDMERKAEELEQACKKKAEQQTALYNDLCRTFISKAAGYVSWKKKEQLSVLYEQISNNYVSSYMSKLNPAQCGFDITLPIEEWRSQHNKEFLDSALKKYQAYFDQMFRYPLDNQQRTAVLADEDYMQIVAGAGSGKTTTIQAKVKYLTEIQKVPPEKILLLAFNRSAKQEMQKRICDSMGIGVSVHTFHSFGLSIVRNSLGGKRVHEEDREPVIKTSVRELIRKRSQAGNDFGQKLLDFSILYQIEPKSRFDFDKMDQYYSMLGNIGYHTVRSSIQDDSCLEQQAADDLDDTVTFQGERVRSYEELVIANYLFLNGIDYVYEREFPPEEWQSLDNQSYKPDFYLPEYDLYWEHFGVNKNEDPPQYMKERDARSYIESMNLKRRRYKELGRPLIQSFSWQFSGGKIYEYLNEILRKYQIEKKPIPADEIIQALLKHAKNRLFKQSTELIESYLSLYKSNGKKKEDLADAKRLVVCQSDFDRTRTGLFFDIFAEIFDEYEKELKSNNKLDFNDMILMAAEQIECHSYVVPFDYVIVDEYQDMSNSRHKLLKALVSQKPDTKLFGVGDDWQSIYRFTGSDLDYFTGFQEKYWPHSLRLKIEQTHRNSQQLVDIAGRFIMKNDRQIPKMLKSDLECDNPILILQYQNSEKDKQKQLKPAHAAVLEAVKWLKQQTNGLENKDILILGRNNATVDSIKGIAQKRYPGLQYSTVHRSKGSEADAVILADVLDGLNGFPNKMVDDPILQSLLAAPEPFLYAQERRLFYVALTRTRTRIVITTDLLKQSCFLSELMEEAEHVITRTLSEEDMEADKQTPVCRLCGGKMVRRQRYTDGHLFWGCSNFKYGCRYTMNIQE